MDINDMWKKLIYKLWAALTLLALLASLSPARAQETPEATETVPTPTATSRPPTRRPIVVVQSYSTDVDTISPGSSFNAFIMLVNSGTSTATNLVVSFSSGDFTPMETGGVVALGTVFPDNRIEFKQPLIASSDTWGKRLASLQMTISYNDNEGALYTEEFLLTFGITTPSIPAVTATPTPTPTPATILRPQLVISSYSTDIEVLQPGSQFNLELTVQNMGNSKAQRVTMIVGGGSAHGSIPGGTPEPGGTSGSGGEFTNFAPLGSSNIQSIGDLDIGDSTQTNQSLIVNVTTNPGAYSMKISFSYLDDRGNIFTDDQVITLLVYSVPIIEISFYMEPPPFFAGQPNMLPLQITNMGKKSVVFGNMRVTAEGAQLSNNVYLVGFLDTGGYTSLDATLIPDLPGPLELLVTVDYVDDFNQAQTITKTIPIEVQEMPIFEPPPEGPDGSGGFGEPMPVPEETFWQKVWRFVKGLLGLDSGITAGQGPIEGFPVDMPMEGGPVQIVP
jgi:hypothetical protein